MIPRDKMWHPTKYAHYFVSRAGEVYSDISGKTLKVNFTGPLKTQPRISIGGEPVDVADLLCETFYGPRPWKHVVYALNRDRRDLRVSNLCWMTRTEVMRRSPNRRVGSGHPRSQFSEEDVREIRRLVTTMGRSQWGVAKKYDTHPNNISRIVRRETYREVM